MQHIHAFLIVVSSFFQNNLELVAKSSKNTSANVFPLFKLTMVESCLQSGGSLLSWIPLFYKSFYVDAYCYQVSLLSDVSMLNLSKMRSLCISSLVT